MKLLLITSYILTLQIFGMSADTPIHQNVVRVPLHKNTQQSDHHSQLLRQALPIRPPNTTTFTTPPTTTEPPPPPTTTNTPDGENLSCSQTIEVTSERKLSYHFVVDEHNAANLHCVIIIFGQRGRQLLLQLTEVDLQPGLFDCEIDAVQVYTLSDGKLSFKDKFCNLSHPSPEILTENNVAVLTFNSGSQLNEEGFKIEVQPLLLPEQGNIHYGYIDTGYGYGSGSYTGYVTNYTNSDYTSYNPPVYTDTGYSYGSGSHTGYVTNYNNSAYTTYNTPAYTDYSDGYKNTSYTKYVPPSSSHANGYFNTTRTNYNTPQYVHYGPPVNYQNANECNRTPWQVTLKPDVTYGGYVPTKSHLNNEFYAWLTSVTKNKWSKEID